MVLPSPTPPPISSGTARAVLEGVVGGWKSIGQLASKLGKDKSTIKYHLDRLRMNGLIERVGYLWFPTNEGKAYFLRLPQKTPTFPMENREGKVPVEVLEGGEGEKLQGNRGGNSVQGGRVSYNAVFDSVRLHKIWITLGSRVEVSRFKLPEKRVVLAGGAWYSDVRVADGLVRVFSNGKVMGKPKSFWGKSYDECEGLLREWLVGWLTMVQEQLGFRFISSQGTILKLSSGEVAYVNEHTARKAQARDFKIKIFDENGRLRLLSDLSLGDPELEVVDSKNFRIDAKEVEHLWQRVIDGKMRTLFDTFPVLNKDFEDLAQAFLSQTKLIKQMAIQQQLNNQRLQKLEEDK